MKPRPVLVTAGATRNPIDQMRHISGNSSGRTGVVLAAALSDHLPLHFLGSPEALLRAWEPLSSGTLEEFGSTRDLMHRMERWVRANPAGIVIHAAAVGDYETEPIDGKVESGREPWTLVLRPTPKIADHLRDWGGPGVLLVTFKAAAPGTGSDALLSLARRQLERTRSDLVFANVLGDLDRHLLLVDAHGASTYEHRAETVAALIAWVLRNGVSGRA
jgi:phosphopantothenoylcysteine decarboxylase/phosphopantothenate--cysteine ligase